MKKNAVAILSRMVMTLSSRWSIWAPIRLARSRSLCPRVDRRSLNCCLAVDISCHTSVTSRGVEEVVSRGAADTSSLLYSATPKAASIWGKLPSFTLVWASPTRSRLNQATRLAATVKATATPKAEKSWVEMRKRRASRRFIKFISCQYPAAFE